MILTLVIGIVYARFYAVTPDKIMKTIIEENKDAVISVGIWQDGKEDKYIYTANGKEDFVPYTYQIGSITKTFTGAMMAYEEARGKIDMAEGDPSFDLLVTHRSGFSDEWEQKILVDPDLTFSRADMYALAGSMTVTEGIFEYSNFGSAFAGTMAAEIYGRDKKLKNISYQDAMNDFIASEIGLNGTKIGGSGDFKYNYKWKNQDEMMAAGSITSNITDLLKYGECYLSDEKKYGYLKNAVRARTNVDGQYDIGMFWLIDRSSGLIWHNGEIEIDDENGKSVGYQSFIGILPQKNKVVVILSNAVCNADDGTAYTDILGYLLMQ